MSITKVAGNKGGDSLQQVESTGWCIGTNQFIQMDVSPKHIQRNADRLLLGIVQLEKGPLPSHSKGEREVDSETSRLTECSNRGVFHKTSDKYVLWYAKVETE